MMTVFGSLGMPTAFGLKAGHAPGVCAAERSRRPAWAENETGTLLKGEIRPKSVCARFAGPARSTTTGRFLNPRKRK